MIGEFNTQKFSLLLKKATGKPTRSINEYGRQAGVSGSYISRLQQRLVNRPPSPAIIQKLADQAANGVTYNQLMAAAGHLTEAPGNAEDIELRNAAVKRIIQSDLLSGRAKKIEDLPASDLTSQLKQLGVELISLPYATDLTEDQMRQIIETVKKVLSSQKGHLRLSLRA